MEGWTTARGGAPLASICARPLTSTGSGGASFPPQSVQGNPWRVGPPPEEGCRWPRSASALSLALDPVVLSSLRSRRLSLSLGQRGGLEVASGDPAPCVVELLQPIEDTSVTKQRRTLLALSKRWSTCRGGGGASAAPAPSSSRGGEATGPRQLVIVE